MRIFGVSPSSKATKRELKGIKENVRIRLGCVECQDSSKDSVPDLQLHIFVNAKCTLAAVLMYNAHFSATTLAAAKNGRQSVLVVDFLGGGGGAAGGMCVCVRA